MRKATASATALLAALALSAALVMGLVPAALAAPSVTYAGRDEVFVFADGSGYAETDLFGSMKDVMPGDTRTQTVVVENEGELPITVYLSAEAHDEAGNPPTYSEAYEEEDLKDGGKDPESGDYLGGEGERDEDAATMADFLAQLNLKVTLGSTVLFDGAPHQPGMLGEPSSLGELAPGESATLSLELSAPAGLGNEYMDRVGEVDWVFSVEEADPEPGAGLDGTGDAAPLAGLAAIAALAAALALALALAAARRRREGGE